MSSAICMKGAFLLFFMVCVTIGALGQSNDVKLVCLLNEKMEPPAGPGPNSIRAKDLKAVWVSKTDTAVKACSDGMVTVILHDGDGKWEVLFTHDDLTFWYSGLSVLRVVKGQKIKKGEVVAVAKLGDRVVLQLMDSETSVDPKEFLECGE